MKKESPLAARMRPQTLEEVVGRDTSSAGINCSTVQSKRIKSVRLFCTDRQEQGKTTLAKVIAHTTKAEFMQINATVSGKKDMEEVVEKARNNRGMYQKKVIPAY